MSGNRVCACKLVSLFFFFFFFFGSSNESLFQKLCLPPEGTDTGQRYSWAVTELIGRGWGFHSVLALFLFLPAKVTSLRLDRNAWKNPTTQVHFRMHLVHREAPCRTLRAPSAVLRQPGVYLRSHIQEGGRRRVTTSGGWDCGFCPRGWRV